MNFQPLHPSFKVYLKATLVYVQCQSQGSWNEISTLILYLLGPHDISFQHQHCDVRRTCDVTVERCFPLMHAMTSWVEMLASFLLNTFMLGMHRGVATNWSIDALRRTEQGLSQTTPYTLSLSTSTQ